MRRSDIRELFKLQNEFENYFQSLSAEKRKELSARRERRFLRDGFGKNPAFHSLVAEKDGSLLGFIVYTRGYDPDEMLGRVMYVNDLFVTKKARGTGVGKALMKNVAQLCRKAKGVDIYFCVWKKNRSAFKFYNRLGAERINDMVWMDWPKEKW